MAIPTLPERMLAAHAEDKTGAPMSFFDHLVELRKRLISAVVGDWHRNGRRAWLVAKHFIIFIIQPMLTALRANHLDDKLYYTSPAGYISLVINLGLYLGIVIAMPWVLYQVWLFVAPGLYKHERNAVVSFIVSAFVCCF